MKKKKGKTFWAPPANYNFLLLPKTFNLKPQNHKLLLEVTTKATKKPRLKMLKQQQFQLCFFYRYEELKSTHLFINIPH